MKKSKKSKSSLISGVAERLISLNLWLIYFTVVFVIAVLIYSGLVILGLPGSYSFLIALAVLISLIGFSLMKKRGSFEGQFFGYYEVPEKHEAIVEIAGKYIGHTLKPGWYFLFPFFNLLFVKDVLQTNEQMIDLFEVGNDNKVDFKDGAAAKVKGNIFFKIENVQMASYNISDYESSLREKIEAAVRSYMGTNTLEFVNENKGKIALNTTVSKGTLDEIETKWGIVVSDLTITDIELSEEDIKLRKQNMEMEIKKQIAEKEAEIKKIEAEGRKRATILDGEASAKVKELDAEARKKATILDGEALAKKIDEMAKMKIDEKIIMAYLESELKWKNIGDKAIIIDDGQGIAGIIARLKTLGSII